MSLIANRVRKWSPFAKNEQTQVEATRKIVAEVEHSGPPLVLLVSDASGRASYQFNSFPDAAAAREFVKAWFPTQQDGGVIAFWALEAEQAPAAGEDASAEPLVLIRDEAKGGVVYLFSFVDMEGAHAFVRSEMESGVDRDSVLIYWAAQVRMNVDEAGSVTFTPEFPPNSNDAQRSEFIKDEITIDAGPLAPEVPPTSGWARVIGRNVQASQQVEAVAPISAPASVKTQLVEAKTRVAPIRAAAPTVETVAEITVAPVEAAARAVAPVEPIQVVAAESAPVEAVRQEELVAAAIATTEKIQNHNGAPKRAAERRPRARILKGEGLLAEEVQVLDEPAGPPKWFEAKDGVPPLDGDTWRNDGFHDLEMPDINEQLEKVLKVKRWELQEGPFQGFQSPPGRF